MLFLIFGTLDTSAKILTISNAGFRRLVSSDSIPSRIQLNPKARLSPCVGRNARERIAADKAE
jgi:hypothetical protein